MLEYFPSSSQPSSTTDSYNTRETEGIQAPGEAEDQSLFLDGINRKFNWVDKIKQQVCGPSTVQDPVR